MAGYTQISEMVERVARTLTIAEGSDPDGETTIADRPKRWMLVIEDARAAIAAMHEPTEAMAEAGAAETLAEDWADPVRVWKAMHNVALGHQTKS